jgi:hypothetical protein
MIRAWIWGARGVKNEKRTEGAVKKQTQIMFTNNAGNAL